MESAAALASLTFGCGSKHYANQSATNMPPLCGFDQMLTA